MDKIKTVCARVLPTLAKQAFNLKRCSGEWRPPFLSGRAFDLLNIVISTFRRGQFLAIRPQDCTRGECRGVSLTF